MRFFPNAPRTPLLAALATSVVLAGMIAIPAAQADDERELRDKQKSVQGQIESTNADLEQSSADLRAAGVALERARTQLAGARLRLVDVQSQLESARATEDLLDLQLDQTVAQLATAREQLVAGTEAAAAQRRVFADTVIDIYERGDPQLLAFASILDARTPGDVTRQMNFNDVVVDKQDTAYDDLTAAEAQLAAQQTAVEQAKADVTAQRDAAAEHVDEVQALQEEAAAAESDITSLVVSRRTARTAANAARAADAAELEALRKQDAEIKKQILAAKKAAEEAAAAARAANQASTAYTGPAGGLLLSPVDGRVTSSFGYRRHPIYGYWGLHDGTDFGAGCGQPLRAAGDGTVLTTVYSSSYGNRLFLDLGLVNGKALTVVYNHMSGYAARTGTKVEEGDVVGYVGTTGWSTGCHLHFTVLEDGDSVDPMKYL